MIKVAIFVQRVALFLIGIRTRKRTCRVTANNGDVFSHAKTLEAYHAHESDLRRRGLNLYLRGYGKSMRAQWVSANKGVALFQRDIRKHLRLGGMRTTGYFITYEVT